MTGDRHAFWDGVYERNAETGVSWFQPFPEASLSLIRASGAGPASAIVDVGGGASRLVDALLGDGFTNLTVVDLSAAALEVSKARLRERASQVRWIIADATRWRPELTFDVWHDRAAFHFLTDAEDRSRYIENAWNALAPGGHAIIGTFALDGPSMCSGLPVVRYDAATLRAAFGARFEMTAQTEEAHTTPTGRVQHFQFGVFRRR